MSSNHKLGEETLRFAGEPEVLGQYKNAPSESLSLRAWILRQDPEQGQLLEDVPTAVLIDLYSHDLTALAEKVTSSFHLYENATSKDSPGSIALNWLTDVGMAVYGSNHGAYRLTWDELLFFNQFGWKIRDAVKTDSVAYTLNEAIISRIQKMSGWTEVVAGLWLSCWLVAGEDFLDDDTRRMRKDLIPYSEKYLQMLTSSDSFQTLQHQFLQGR